MYSTGHTDPHQGLIGVHASPARPKRFFSLYCCCGSFVFLFAAVYAGLLFLYPITDPEIRWDWNAIKASPEFATFSFPPDFYWGTATAAHQVEGGNTNNQWWEWEHTDGKIKTGENSGRADDHYNLYAEDMAYMREQLHANMYRFSVEWSRIEPRRGEYDEKEILHYHAMIDTMKAAGLEPMLTLFHFTIPLWFRDMGGFEKEENIAYFTAFSRKVFTEYSGKVRFWCTMNEPNVYTTVGYSVGDFPPGLHDNKIAAEVMKNLALAHVNVYHELKALDTKKGTAGESMIGIVPNIMQFDPDRAWHPIERLAATMLNGVYDSILNFLLTGHFKFVQPGVVDLQYTDMAATKTLDYIGVNYYYNMPVRSKLSLTEPFQPYNRSEGMYTDMGWPIYPEGIYRALMSAKRFNLPIYVTENGVADGADTRRADFIQTYLYAVWRAKQDGADVRGYMYWSFMDNFEWAEGFRPRFGLYRVDYSTMKRTLYEGSKKYIEIVKRSRFPPNLGGDKSQEL